MIAPAGAVSVTFNERLRDPARWSQAADIVAVLIALSLPWSTSLVSILTVVWVIAVAPTLDVKAFLQSLRAPIAALPIALFTLAVVGMLWSDAAWPARTHSAGQTLKFLMLPLLLYHYQRSPNAVWVLAAFVASCGVLLAVSFASAIFPMFATPTPGVPVKNYIDQSQEFSLCAVGLGYPIMHYVRQRRYLPAALLTLLALGFVADMLFVISSRTALVSLPILLLLFAFRLMKWRGVVASIALVVLLGAAAWMTSPQLRAKITSPLSEYSRYETSNEATSTGLRLEFWRKSLQFFAASPLIGHGTGSIEGQFMRAAVGNEGTASAEIIRNPHNQTLAAAVQWGALGIVVLYTMWVLHLLLMQRFNSAIASIGLLVVVQNIVTSVFNSHLLDFHAGWMYVLGVGIAGGVVTGQPFSAGVAAQRDRLQDRSVT